MRIFHSTGNAPDWWGTKFHGWVAPKKLPDCPKCDSPSVAKRHKGGEERLICANGHDWARDLIRANPEADKAEVKEKPSSLTI